MRLAQTVVRSFDRDIGAVIARLERHARAVDQTAVATELLKAAQFRKESDRRHHEDFKIQCERWLRPADVRHVHLHQVRARLDGTCDWIASNSVFERWVQPGCLTPQDRLLVISGTHGCGKSVLASAIVARIENDGQHTLFFAFSSSDGSRQTSESLIRTLLWQLLHQTNKTEFVDTVQRLRSNGQPTIAELWEAFGCLASSLAKPVYCVIDGIDECTDHDHDHIIPIKPMQILERCPNLHILLLGRPHVIQAYADGSGSPAINITSAMLDQDIEAFINNEIDKSDILSLPEFRQDVYKTLKVHSDGMFLWVRLMVDDLGKSSSKSEFSQRLQNLPHGLEEAYQLHFLRLTAKLDKFELRLAQNALAFTITSYRPLSFDEFRYAHALHCRSSDTVAQPLEEYLLLQPLQRVLDVTGGLISMTDGVLRLIHSSVRDFLVRPEDRWVCEPDKAVVDFRVDITQTRLSFAWLCLDYMRLEIEATKHMNLDTPQSTQAPQDSCHLLRYATSYVFYHLNRSGPPCSTTLAKIETLLSSTHVIHWVEHFAHLTFGDIAPVAQWNEFGMWEDRMGDAGLDNLNDSTDSQLGTFNRTQSNEAQCSVLDSSGAAQHLQSRNLNSKQTSNDSSAAVSRVMGLRKGQHYLSVAHQIQKLRLLTSLQTRVRIDNLEVLLQLILMKASGIPISAFMLIGRSYEQLENISRDARSIHRRIRKNESPERTTKI